MPAGWFFLVTLPIEVSFLAAALAFSVLITTPGSLTVDALVPQRAELDPCDRAALEQVRGASPVTTVATSPKNGGVQSEATVEVDVIDSGHLAALSRPDELARRLEPDVNVIDEFVW